MNSDSIYEDARSRIVNDSMEREERRERERNGNDSGIYEDADCNKVEKVKGGAKHDKMSSSTETAFENVAVKSGCCKGQEGKACFIV